MNYICRYTRYIYGHSGNDLTAPVEKIERYTIKILPGETHAEFLIRTQKLGIELRQRAIHLPVRDYSGWDWEWIEVLDQSMDLNKYLGKE